MTARALNINDLPNIKQEEWKYTNLAKAIPANLNVEKMDEISVHVARGQNGGQHKDILFTGLDGVLHNPQLKVVLEDEAELTIIERHCGQGAYWKNMSSEITLGQGATLNHIRIQEDSDQATLTNMAQVSLGRDATYNSFTLTTGGNMSRYDVCAMLNGSGGACNINVVHLLSGKQHADTTLVVDHKAPHCTSHQFIRSVLEGRARSVFQGKVRVDKIAQKTDAYQLSNALLLSDGCTMDTKPELEIYADDVKCSHGATCGQLDENALFYMRSRGIAMEAAKKLLIEAFVDEVVDKVGNDSLAEQIKEKTHTWLSEAL